MIVFVYVLSFNFTEFRSSEIQVYFIFAINSGPISVASNLIQGTENVENEITCNHSNTVYPEIRIFSGSDWGDLLQFFNIFLNEQLHLTRLKCEV